MANKQATHQSQQLSNNREGGAQFSWKYKGIYIYIYIYIYIRVNNPPLNNNSGKFNLPPIWDRVLLNLKRQVNNNNPHN